MGNKKSLEKANKAKDDEYYTFYEDISSEVSKYREQLKGKRILCPCDWDESYNEEIVFQDECYVGSNELFNNGGTVKLLDIFKTKERIEKDLNLIRCNFVKFLVSHAESYGINSISVSGYNPETGEGVRFQDIDYAKYDLIITNPPFSLFIEFIDTMFKYKKQFLIIGPLTALSYRDVFKHIKDNELWLGYAKQLIGFSRPDGSVLLSKNPEGSIPRACKWYTNLDVSYRHDKMILTKKYEPEMFPKYCNYNAIDVNKTIDIPYDYEGEIGVPTTFLAKYNPNQFEIVGYSGILAEKMPIKLPKNLQGGPAFYINQLNGSYKRLFTRLVIKNKQVIKDE